MIEARFFKSGFCYLELLQITNKLKILCNIFALYVQSMYICFINLLTIKIFKKMKATTYKHSLIFDGTSYYIVSFEEAREIQKADEYIEIIKDSDNLDLLERLEEQYNEQL